MRKWPRLLAAGMLVAALGLYPLLAPRVHRIDKAHYALIRNGMTLEEAESILGALAGDYDWAIGSVDNWDEDSRPSMMRERTPSGTTDYCSVDGVITWQSSSGNISKLSPDGTVLWSKSVDPHVMFRTRSWTSRHGHVMIYFDPEERVNGKSSWCSSRIVPPWQRWWGYWRN